MALHSKEWQKTNYLMVRVEWLTQMEMFFKVNGKKVKQMDKDVLLILMEVCMTVNGLMISSMDMEQKVGIIIELNIQEILLKERKVGWEGLNSRVDIMKENF